MSDKLSPNRDSGDWLPEVESCPNRAVPCGNPLDADQAMRAGQIEAGGTNLLSKLQAGQAMKSARNIAEQCKVPSGKCPLERKYGRDRLRALEAVKNSAE